MLELDLAISYYMDMLDNNEKEDLDYFKDNLSPQDYKEFIETVRTLKIYVAKKTTDDFEKLFKNIDRYKDELYPISKAVNFKKDNDADSQAAQDVLNKIFEEEFNKKDE
jgi:hypothetical protein